MVGVAHIVHVVVVSDFLVLHMPSERRSGLRVALNHTEFHDVFRGGRLLGKWGRFAVICVLKVVGDLAHHSSQTLCVCKYEYICTKRGWHVHGADSPSELFDLLWLC